MLAIPSAAAFSSVTKPSFTGFKSTLWLLFGCQALLNAIIIGQFALGPLIGYSLSPNKGLATFPIAVQTAATMAASIPVAFVFERLGRRAGFLLGAALSLLGCLLFAAGVWLGNFWVYCLGGLPVGLGFGIAQHLRFAAAEVAPEAERARAVAFVMAGGILAAILGPEIAKRSQDWFTPVLFFGTYLALAILPVIAAAMLCVARLPGVGPRNTQPASMGAIVRRSEFMVAVSAAVVAYASMNLIMTSAPVQMMLCGVSAADGADVIRDHAIAMYAPGFLTGRVIGRYGARRVAQAGGLLCLGSAAMSLVGNSLLSFTTAMVLLGLGWNLMFIAATTLLASAHNPAERLRAQAANDSVVFGMMACASLGSGILHSTAGWLALNWGFCRSSSAEFFMLAVRRTASPQLAV